MKLEKNKKVCPKCNRNLYLNLDKLKENVVWWAHISSQRKGKKGSCEYKSIRKIKE